MRLRPTEPGIRLSVGLPGSGKSYGMRADVERAARRYPVMVLDTCYEWGDVAPDIRAFGARSVASAVAIFADATKRAQLVVVRPSGDGVAEALAACRWAVSRPGQAGIVFPEAHEHFPNGTRLAPDAQHVVSRWRHSNVSAWFDTQRLAKLSSDIVNTAAGGELRLYAFFGPRDLFAVRDIGGRSLEAGVLKCGEHFDRARRCCARGCAKCAHERGWYVTAGPPPHEPTREQ